MKTCLVTFVTAAALTMCSGLALAQDKAPAPAKPATPAHAAQGEKPAKPDFSKMSQEDMQKMMAEMGKPSKEMVEMAKGAGTWKAECTMYMNGEEHKSTGTAVFKPINNGLHYQQDFSGEMMGMPYKGTGIMTFNPMAQKYQSTWMDSMASGIMFAEGTADSTGKVITLTGKMDCMEGPADCRQVLTHNSADKCTFEMFATQNGKEEKMMTIVYTRTGEAPKAAGGQTPSAMAPASGMKPGAVKPGSTDKKPN